MVLALQCCLKAEEIPQFYSRELKQHVRLPVMLPPGTCRSVGLHYYSRLLAAGLGLFLKTCSSLRVD